MNKIFKYFGFVMLFVFSFCYTNKIGLYISKKNPVMREIISLKDAYNTAYVNAIVDSNTIIPGIWGSEVNINSSFNKMKQVGYFDEDFLVFSNVIPAISIENNIDKVIIKGNSNKKSVAFIIENNETIQSYFHLNKIKANIFAYEENFKNSKDFELLNGELDKIPFDNVNILLDKSKINKMICIIPYNNELLCKNNKMYLVKPNKTLTNSNIIDIKNTITNGDIILISKNSKLSDVVILINEIRFRNMNIVYLSDLISEKR